jgi:pimeloyl-ACP methyl ester carboxylesterase
VSDARALGELAAQAAGGAADIIGDTHRAVASRIFGAVGPPARAVGARALHDGITALVYGAVRASSTGVVRAGAFAASRSQVRLGDTARGRLLLGAVNGAWGDLLAEQGSPLAVDMTFPEVPQRHESRLVVFVHGLCETEDAWRLGAERSAPYPDRIASEYGATPLVLRYNTGRHISENGRRLAELLDETVAEWPCEVEDIVLVGHSMGGLVARSACHCAGEERMPWVTRVRHVFSLGSPFGGADLEKAANVAGWLLGSLPETRALARALNRRSVGIKDLRYGNFTDECWAESDLDELLRCTRRDIPWLETAQHTFIAASLFRDVDHPLGRLTGDLLVRRPSAWAGGQHGEKGQFMLDASHAIGPANHFTLLNHPKVYEQISLQLETGWGNNTRPELLEPAAVTAT